MADTSKKRDIFSQAASGSQHFCAQLGSRFKKTAPALTASAVLAVGDVFNARNLTVAGLAVAATAGGAGIVHNTYGTTEDITVAVSRLEFEGSRLLYHTDHGTFVNESSLPHRKGAASVQNINETIKAGERIKLRVHGMNPSVLGFNRDDLRQYRNILAVRPAA